MNQFEEIQLKDYLKSKKRRAFWLGALLGIVAIAIIWAISSIEQDYPVGEQIAHVRIDGGIGRDEYRDEMLAEIAKREDVRAMLVSINSGGGGVYSSEKLFRQIQKISEDRPVVAVMESVAASGAYIAALGSDHIIAGETTITASIGVIHEIVDLTELLDKAGVSSTLVRSSEAKGGISPLRTPTPEEIENERELIDEMFIWFRDLVGERRNLRGNALNAVADGSVVTGIKALEKGLIDQLGDFEDGIAYLREQEPSFVDLEVKDWTPLYPEEDWASVLAGGIANAFVNIIDEQETQISVPLAK